MLRAPQVARLKHSSRRADRFRSSAGRREETHHAPRIGQLRRSPIAAGKECATYHPRRRRAVPLPRFGQDVVRPQALGSKARVADRSAGKPEIWPQRRFRGPILLPPRKSLPASALALSIGGKRSHRLPCPPRGIICAERHEDGQLQDPQSPCPGILGRSRLDVVVLLPFEEGLPRIHQPLIMGQI